MTAPQLYPEDLIRQFFAKHIAEPEFSVSQISEELMMRIEKVRRQIKRFAKCGHVTITVRKGGHRGQANVICASVTICGRKFLKENGFIPVKKAEVL